MGEVTHWLPPWAKQTRGNELNLLPIKNQRKIKRSKTNLKNFFPPTAPSFPLPPPCKQQSEMGSRGQNEFITHGSCHSSGRGVIPLLGVGSSQGRESSKNFFSTSPCHELQLLVNCSNAGRFPQGAVLLEWPAPAFIWSQAYSLLSHFR